eukprot:scaffold2973_cov39-Phaeocystis_antarctica.AAC.1
MLLEKYDADAPDNGPGAKYSINGAFFDKRAEENADDPFDFPSTELFAAGFEVSKHFTLPISKELLAYMMVAFDGYKLQPKTVQAKEDDEGNDVEVEMELRMPMHTARPAPRSSTDTASPSPPRTAIARPAPLLSPLSSSHGQSLSCSPLSSSHGAHRSHWQVFAAEMKLNLAWMGNPHFCPSMCARPCPSKLRLAPSLRFA